MNIISLDAYREQKRAKRPSGAGDMFRFAGWPPLGAAGTKPAFMMCWVMFMPMPVMVPVSQRSAAVGA